MALVLNFVPTETASRKAVSIKETTGAYSASNTGGYGAPNPATSDVATKILTSQKRNDDGTYTDVADHSYNGFTILPSSINQSELVSAENLDYGDDATFEDGIYKLIYTVTGTFGGNPFTYSKEVITPFYGNIRCCFQKKSLKIVQNNTCCSEAEDYKCFASLYLALQTAIAAYENLGENNLDIIQNLIDQLSELCEECGCQ